MSTTQPSRSPNLKGSSQTRRRLAEWLQVHPPPGVSADVVEAHLRCMPARYWNRVDESDLPWHLRAIDSFLRKLAGSDAALSPVSVTWRKPDEQAATQVMVCSWDRRGLLEQLAAAFNALRMSVQKAEVYTRTDSLALDLFDITESDGSALRNDERLEGLSFLVEGAFSDPPRFTSIWATEFHKVLPRLERPVFFIRFDNSKSPDQTVLRVRAPDRSGLLYDLVHALTEQGLQISQAVIDTRAGAATDQFYLTDAEGEKVTSPRRLRQLRKELVNVLTS